MYHSERRQLLSQRCNNKLTPGEDLSPLCIPQNCDAVKTGWRGKLGFVGGLRTMPTQRTTKEKTYLVFNDIDLNRVQGSSALIGEHNQPHPR